MLSNTQIERVKNLIKIESGIDVNQKSREREVVEMRAVYYKVLKDVMHLSLTAIARTVNVNHATVIYSLNNFDIWASFNKNMAVTFNNIKITLSSSGDFDGVYEDVLAMRRKIEILEQSNMDLNLIIARNLKGKREDLHNLVNQIPEDKISKARQKIDALILCL